jgi:hypothetical protein
LKGPLFNQDSTEFFYTHTADQMSGEAVDAWVASLAQAGVGALFSNTNAMRANYASKVWETDWHGYDPHGPDDQPVLKYLPADDLPGTRKRLDSAKRLAEMGIDFHARAFARCRERGIGCWVSIRMNDLHDCHLQDSPLLSTFYKEHPEFRRVPYRFNGWPDRALDWAHPEVRDHYMKFVLEHLERWDLDGLELDWMRFGYHFGIGRELDGGTVLTQWIGEVRKACKQAAKRLGHPVQLGVRVPSTPETARNLGLDGAAWAKAGLIDLLVPTPFWATCEFNMPIATWRQLLDGTHCALAGGLEIRYQPSPGANAIMMTPELAAGAAMAVLRGGADFVYLFNYFADMHLGGYWTKEQYDTALRAMGSLADLDRLPRRHAVTYRDVRAPGEPADTPLPASGGLCQFRLQTGPRPTGRKVEALLEVGSADTPAPDLRVNGVLCPAPTKPSERVFVYPVPDNALTDESHVVEATATEGKPLNILRVEFAVGPKAG